MSRFVRMCWPEITSLHCSWIDPPRILRWSLTMISNTARQNRGGRLAIGVILFCAGMAGAGEKRLAFEVISIRRHTEASGPAQRPTTTPNEFRSIGLPMISIFQIAYVPPGQSGVLSGDLIAGGLDWFRSETYDIVAKV